MKIKKKWGEGGSGGGWVGGRWCRVGGQVEGGGQAGCERRIEVFWGKKSAGGGVGRGVRVDDNEELKFLSKIKKENWGRGGGRGGWVGGEGVSGWESKN